MGVGATRPVVEPVEFDSKNIIAQNKQNTRVTLKQHTNDVTAISCFSSSKLSMRNNSEQIKISVRGAGVLRIGVTEKDPKLQQNFAEDPLFEQEDGFEPGSAERVLYYHENLEMFCYGPADKFMEFSPNRTKLSSGVYLYVVCVYGKPTVSVTYKDVVVNMTTFESSNLRTLEDSSMTVATVKNVSIMKLKKKIEHGNVYHIQWNMDLSKEKFAKKPPKFGYLRIGLMNGGLDDINAFSINAEARWTGALSVKCIAEIHYPPPVELESTVISLPVEQYNHSANEPYTVGIDRTTLKSAPNLGDT